MSRSEDIAVVEAALHTVALKYNLVDAKASAMQLAVACKHAGRHGTLLQPSALLEPFDLLAEDWCEREGNLHRALASYVVRRTRQNEGAR